MIGSGGVPSVQAGLRRLISASLSAAVTRRRGQPETQRDLGDAQPLDDVQLPQSFGGWCGWAVPGRSPWPAGSGPVQPGFACGPAHAGIGDAEFRGDLGYPRATSSREHTWSSVIGSARLRP